MLLSTTSTRSTRLVQHLRDSTKKAEGSRTTKRRLPYQTLELIRQRGAARAAGNYQLTSELAKRCREAIKEDLKERQAAVLVEAAEAGKSVRNTRRDLANRKAKMTITCPTTINATTLTEGSRRNIVTGSRRVCEPPRIQKTSLGKYQPENLQLIPL
ncbi:hypothetical protein ANCDUO_02024 [Ancylostoma duodenale]|uniref:Uncharacterized protein n=1 Tax=Ancylostoma duodenale TaxID=51022 RepID=A0A0C2DCQ6_9BILA|nr:hypothetical protein ANCDUO_02024 [Ancylostoma duodenale]